MTMMLPLFEAPTFTKETARAVLEPLIESVRARASTTSKKVMGNFFLGGDASFLSARSVDGIKDVGMLFWVSRELLCSLEETLVSKYDDVSAIVARVARASRLEGFEKDVQYSEKFEVLRSERSAAAHAVIQRRADKTMHDRFGEKPISGWFHLDEEPVAYDMVPTDKVIKTKNGATLRTWDVVPRTLPIPDCVDKLVEEPSRPLGMPKVAHTVETSNGYSAPVEEYRSAYPSIIDAMREDHDKFRAMVKNSLYGKNNKYSLKDVAKTMWDECKSLPQPPLQPILPVGVDGTTARFCVSAGWKYLGREGDHDVLIDGGGCVRCVDELFSTRPWLVDVYGPMELQRLSHDDDTHWAARVLRLLDKAQKKTASQ